MQLITLIAPKHRSHIQKGKTIMTATNPVLRLATNALGIATFAGYLAIVAIVTIVGFTLTMLPVALKVAFGATFTLLCVACIATYVVSNYAIEWRKPIAIGALLVAAVVAVGALCIAQPMVIVGGAIIASYAVVTKPK